MKLHANAALSLNHRRRMVRRVVEHGWSLTKAAEAAEVSERTCSKWVERYRAEGEAGLRDRSSAPRSIPHRTPADRVELIEALRRLRMTGAEIAECLGMALSTVSAVLLREGLGKRSRLQPLEPVNRYERSAPGELVHIDIKKLGRIEGGPGKRVTGRRRYTRSQTDAAGVRRKRIGWEYVHVAVDDYSRLAYAEILDDEKASSAIAFLRRAVAFFARHGVQVERVMTDNGSPYTSGAHRIACHELGLRHLRTQPYRPRTNGKAERFIQTLLRRWAYYRPYGSSTERAAALGPWLKHYNFTPTARQPQPQATRLTTDQRAWEQHLGRPDAHERGEGEQRTGHARLLAQDAVATKPRG
jgi:transposase InsO family protein